jgi:putative transposase
LVLYHAFLKGHHGCARTKRYTDIGSVHLTNELYKFIYHENGKISLIVGTPKYPVGEIRFIPHRQFSEPKSIHLKVEAGQWWVSFCYNDFINPEDLIATKDFLNNVCHLSEEELARHVIGTDRGIAVAAQTSEQAYDLAPKARTRIKKRQIKIKGLNKKLAQ